MRICGTQSTAVCLLDSRDKHTAIVEVVEHCSVFSAIADRPSFIRQVIARERVQSTGIGHGVAIAHGKLKDLDQVHIGLGISYGGIDFESSDHLPVHLLFVIASSPALQIQYLASLSAILRSVHSEEIRALLVDLPRHRSEGSVRSFLAMMESQDFALHPLQ